MKTPGIQVNRIREVNEEVILVNWYNIGEVEESLRTVNVVLAAFTTAWTRLKIYKHLEALGCQVLYFDIDSVLYIYKNGLHRIPTGDYLWEITDELADYSAGSYIVEFMSGGPKTYVNLEWSTNKNEFVEFFKLRVWPLSSTLQKDYFRKLKQLSLVR